MHAKALSLSSSRRALLAGAVALLLAGCASMNSVSVNVVSFGSWPTGRALGSYVVDRLPSQQQGGGPRLAAEAAARRALEQVGFKPAASEEQADVVVQLGVSHSKVLDPWAGWGFYGGRSALGCGRWLWVALSAPGRAGWPLLRAVWQPILAR